MTLLVIGRVRECNKRLDKARVRLQSCDGRPDLADALQRYIRLTERERDAVQSAAEAWEAYLRLVREPGEVTP